MRMELDEFQCQKRLEDGVEFVGRLKLVRMMER